MQNVCRQERDAAWKQTSNPTVQKHRDKWVVRVDGIDAQSGTRKLRQIGTYPSRRSAQSAATAFAAAGELAADCDSVAHVVDRWVSGKVDVSNKTRQQYEWAAGHIRSGIGGVRVDQLDRDDVARWLESLADDGKFALRSIQIMRMVLRASLADAVDIGELCRSPAARVGMPRNVAKTSRQRDVNAWTDEELGRFLVSVADHRWAGARSVSRRCTDCDEVSCSACRGRQLICGRERFGSSGGLSRCTVGRSGATARTPARAE